MIMHYRVEAGIEIKGMIWNDFESMPAPPPIIMGIKQISATINDLAGVWTLMINQ